MANAGSNQVQSQGFKTGSTPEPTPRPGLEPSPNPSSGLDLGSSSSTTLTTTPTSTFFALVMRMRYIDRWMLMRNSQPENLAEHSLDVAMMAHALCTLANVRYGAHLDADRAAVIALYHDAAEIVTGDLPTPVKYFNKHTRAAYAEAEASATSRLLATLPADIRPVYESLMGTSQKTGVTHEEMSSQPPSSALHEASTPQESTTMHEANASQESDDGRVNRAEQAAKDARLYREVKAADKLSALVKCLQEKSAGNPEFRSAEKTTRASLAEMEKDMPELRDFLTEFLPSFEATLDELLQ